MNREQLELVTAYVDGEATADERARVEADAELLAEVERQRAARAELHDLEPPAAVARESAIAAALAVFDEEVASTTKIQGGPAPAGAIPDVTAPTNIVPFERRRRMRWMQGVGAAAAVTAVVVAGAVIATRGTDDSGTADQARENTELSVVTGPPDQAEPDQDEEVPPPAAAEVATTDATVLMAAEPTSAAEPTQSAAEAESATAGSVSEYDDSVPAADAGGGAPAAEPPTAAAAPAPVITATAGMIVVVTEDDLREFADTLKATPPHLDDAESDCTDGSLKGEAVYEDDDGVQHPIVVVAIDDNTLGALALDDCEVVLEADVDAVD